MMQLVSDSILNQFFPGLSSLGILRLDLPDPVAGGNKRYKLKYNLSAFHERKCETLLTFGGAYSNHIAATAEACAQHQIPVVGIIRGDELNADSNDVLRFAASRGMKLVFVSRENYKRRNDAEYHSSLKSEYGNIFLLPEGGSNALAVQGCKEILSVETEKYDRIICPVGTGGTVAGIIASAKQYQHITGVAVLEGRDYLLGLIHSHLHGHEVSASWNLESEHTLGGYANTSEELNNFMRAFTASTQIPLDRIYSGKVMFALYNMVKAGQLQNQNVVFVHTGGYAFSPKY